VTLELLTAVLFAFRRRLLFIRRGIVKQRLIAMKIISVYAAFAEMSLARVAQPF
jgi:hypothetical protein